MQLVNMVYGDTSLPSAHAGEHGVWFTYITSLQATDILYVAIDLQFVLSLPWLPHQAQELVVKKASWIILRV